LAVLACCIVLFTGTVAHAGFLAGNALAYNDGNGPFLGAWTGSSPFANGNLTGYVDWAVFTDTDFNSLFLGGGYVPPAGEYVYAHQIFTTGALIGASGMDIVLAGYPAGNGGSFSTLIPPVNGVPVVFASADPNLATFVLATETDLLTPSDGLVYSSPNPPQLSGTPIVVDGGTSADGELPIGIPGVPEPATWLLGSAATVLWFGVRRVRRNESRCECSAM
jgi:hypothetical protein